MNNICGIRVRLTLSGLLGLLPWVEPVAQAQYHYETVGGAITITGYSGAAGALTIPSTINNLPVTSIGVGAFYNSTLVSVAIPGGVTSIGIHAFYGCRLLTNVVIAGGVSGIGVGAFSECMALAS